MRDDTRRNLAFWGVSGLAVALFVAVYSQAGNGEGDFADSPPSLAPFAATQAPSPSPVREMQAPSPSPPSPSLSAAPSAILPRTLGREIAVEPPLPPPATGTSSTSSGSSPGPGTSSPKPTVSADRALRASGTLNTNGSLTINFKEAGLGANQLINNALTADATATYVCVKSDGDKASAQDKTTVVGPVSASGTFNSGKNGEVTASLTVSPPSSDISCPPKQSLELASDSYTNVVLTDTTNHVTIEVGDFSSGCLLPNVKGAC